MSINVTCDECFFDYTVKDQFAGKRIKCKECGAAIRIPAVDQFEEDDDFLEDRPPRREKPQKQHKAIVKSRKKKPARKPYSSGLGTPAIAGGIGTFLLIAFFVVVKTGLLQNLIPSGVKWVEYTSPDGNVTALLPGKATEKKMPLDAEAMVSQRIDIAGNRYFGAGITSIQMREEIVHPVSGTPLSPTGIKLYLLPESISAFPGSRVIETRESVISGIPALIAKVEMPLPGGEIVINEMAMVTVGEYLYSAEFIIQKGKNRDDDKKKFFDSVKFNNAIIQKYQALNPQAIPPVVAKNEPQNPEPPKTTPTVSPPVAKVTPKPTPEKKLIPDIISWTAKPDPLLEIPDWKIAKRVAIDLPDITRNVYRPDPYGPDFIAGFRSGQLKNLSIYSLETGKKLTTFSDTPKVISGFCFSPDVKLIGTYKINSGKVEIWDIDREKLSKNLLIDEKGGKKIQRIIFTDASHVLVIQKMKDGLEISELNLFDLSEDQKDLKPVSTFHTRSWNYEMDIVRSAGHRYLAGISLDKKRVLILDWENGKMAGELKIKDPTQYERYAIKGLAFAPDGKSIAVLAGTVYQTTVFGFSTLTGEIKWKHNWPFYLNNMMPGIVADNAKNGQAVVNWLADSSAYSLKGRLLIDAKTGKYLWYLDSFPEPISKRMYNYRSKHLIPQGMLCIESDDRFKRQVQIKRFTFNNLQKSLALLDQPEQLKIGPQKKVRLEIEIAAVHQAEKDQVKKEFTELWKEKLDKLGIEVVEQADYVLRFDYKELPGETITYRSMGQFRGEGKSYVSTKMQYRIQWLPSGESISSWETEHEYRQPAYSMRGEISVKTIRDKIFKDFKQTVTGLTIVYLIPKDDKLPMLPQTDTTNF